MMILKSMNEVIEFSVSYQNSKTPDFYEKPLKKRSNIPFDENLISKFGLPAEYIKFVRAYAIEGVELHTLNLTPSRRNNLLGSLDDLNQPGTVDYDERYIAVSSVEADNIVLMRGQHMHNDSAVYFKEHFPSNQKAPDKIADSFEQLVLIFTSFQTFETLPETERELKFREVLDWISPAEPAAFLSTWERVMCLS